MANYCCGNCEVWEKGSRSFGDEHYCKVKGKSFKATASACSSIVKNRSAREAESREYKRAGWYITTAICNIIKAIYGKESDMYMQLAAIRTDFLEVIPEGKSTLEDYDYFGPMIAKIIEEDPNKLAVADYLREAFLELALASLQNGDFEQANQIYMNMVTMLKIKYNLIQTAVDTKTSEEIKNYDTALTRKKPNKQK